MEFMSYTSGGVGCTYWPIHKFGYLKFIFWSFNFLEVSEFKTIVNWVVLFLWHSYLNMAYCKIFLQYTVNPVRSSKSCHLDDLLHNFFSIVLYLSLICLLQVLSCNMPWLWWELQNYVISSLCGYRQNFLVIYHIYLSMA